MKKILFVVVTIILIGITSYFAFVSGDGSDYYTQIDNSKMEKIETSNGVINFKGSLPYSYTLTCYNATGKKKELHFTSEKQLRQDAFLHLKVKSIRGVVNWSEVQYNELPHDVQKKYE